MRVRLSIALSVLAAVAWAAPTSGAARFFARGAKGLTATEMQTASATTGPAVPRAARFRIDEDRGLLINTWVNGRGPYVFAIDTGAGLNIISERLVKVLGLKVSDVEPTLVVGISGATRPNNQEAQIKSLALGYRENVLPGDARALVLGNLPPGVDGILDPTEAYGPYGYSIDMPKGEINAIADAAELLRRPASDSSIVEWLRLEDSDRPFVKLGDGRVALIDTGSRFGLAISDREAIVVSNRRARTVPSLDLGGGTVNARRVQPTTISIGELVLRRIPTDIISGSAADAPLILGRDALYPFKISFDPQQRRIAFVASER